MLDLASHGDCKQNTKVDEKNRPEHGDVKDAEEAAENGNHCSLGCRVPWVATISSHATMHKLSAYQNLNSGNLRMNGLNSSSALVGKDGPSSISFSCVSSSTDGSNFGVKNAKNRLSRYIPIMIQCQALFPVFSRLFFTQRISKEQRTAVRLPRVPTKTECRILT